MTHVLISECLGGKLTDRVPVCPVACFNATEPRQVKESGQDAIEMKKNPLPTRRGKERGTGLLTFRLTSTISSSR